MIVGSKGVELECEQPCAVLLNGSVLVKYDVLVPFLHIISIIQIFLDDVQRNSVGSFAYFVILPYLAYIEYNSLRRRTCGCRRGRMVCASAYYLGGYFPVSVVVSDNSSVGISRRYLDLVEILTGLFKFGRVLYNITLLIRKG